MEVSFEQDVLPGWSHQRAPTLQILFLGFLRKNENMLDYIYTLTLPVYESQPNHKNNSSKLWEPQDSLT